MRKTTKFCLLVLCLCLFAALSASKNATAANFDSEERRIFDLVNQERRKKGLNELSWDSELARLARSYSQKMARENFFSHYDNEGNSLETRARSMRLKKFRKIGENLFYCEGYGNPISIAVRGWMKSPGHRQNILDRGYTETGIGIAESRDGEIYITQVFLEK